MHFRQIKFNIRLLTLCLLGGMSWSMPASSADWIYSFKPGDTIWAVCKEYTNKSNCWQELGPINNIDASRRIPPGTRIRIPASWLKVPAASAELVHVQGDVKLVLPDRREEAATIGAKLHIGAELATQEGSATILFADGSSMLLEPNSRMTLDTLSNFELNGMVDSSIRLQKGTVKTRVIKRTPRSQFRTNTPSAIASVRGTEYRVSVVDAAPQPESNTAQKEKTLVEVYGGLVAVGAEQKEVEVPADFGVVTRKGTPPQAPVKLLPKPSLNDYPSPFATLLTPNMLQQEPLDITWLPMPEAQSFQLNVLQAHITKREGYVTNDSSEQSRDLEKLLQSYRSDTNQVSVTGLEPGCYTLSVKAIDSLGLHGNAAEKPVCIEQRLAAPSLEPLVISAQDDQSDDDGKHTLTLNWPAVGHATQYHIETSTDADFNEIKQTIVSQQTSVVLTTDTDLHVRVRAENQSGLKSDYGVSVSWYAPEPEETDYWKALIPVGIFLLGLI